jgi:hypothetical protein
MTIMTRSALLITMLLVAAGARSAAGQTSLVAPKLLPGTRISVLSSIQGSAVTSSNGQLSNAPIRLRDVRYGRIVDTQLTDKTGTFAFKAVDPGNYIVEVMGPDRTVLAATPVLNVNAGQSLSTVVKLPFKIPPFAGILGNSTPSAAIVTTEAAASGVLATTTAGEPVSPGK